MNLKMASAWFSILVAIFVGHVCAKTSRICPEMGDIMNCDECFRCGGIWCDDFKSRPKCMDSAGVESCPSPLYPSEQDQHPPTGPKHFQLFTSIKRQETLSLGETFGKAAEIAFVNSTIKGVTALDREMIEINIDSDDTSVVQVTAYPEFCPADGRVQEYYTVKIRDPKWVDAKAKLVTFAVPCACTCSSHVEVKSEVCNRRGNFSCNVCTCEKGWSGDTCNEIEDGRGDLDQCEDMNRVICSNNGKCVGNKCVCDPSREGSQYFDNQCTSLCTIISNYHDSCLTNPQEPGPCQDHENEVFIDSLNRTRLSEKYEGSRKLSWVQCEEQTDSCNIKYAAMKDTNGFKHLMYLELCNTIAGVGAVAYTLPVTVPVVLGVLAIVASAAAVAGYMVWKNRTPPLPLNNPGYSNIDAEDCTGMNPLYKPPTSSFKNPTYGKW